MMRGERLEGVARERIPVPEQAFFRLKLSKDGRRSCSKHPGKGDGRRHALQRGVDYSGGNIVLGYIPVVTLI